jgi:DNA-binding transcriptional ArsR family regulator
VADEVVVAFGEKTMIKQSELRNSEELEQLANLFRLLSDRTRLNLLLLLADGERNVTSLCAALKLPQPTVSHHLGLLRMSGAISNRRDGKQVFYSLDGRVSVRDRGVLEVESDNFSIRITPRSGR